MRRAGKIDGNHTAATAALSSLEGCEFDSLAAFGSGIGDLLIGYDGALMIVEMKDGDDKTLTPAQVKWHRRWRGFPVYVAHSVDELLAIVTGTSLRSASVRRPTQHNRRSKT